MPHNALVTGPPRSGKTTAIERTVDRLADDGLRAGGVVAPEMREGGERVGFELRDVLTGDVVVMAHVDHDEGPRVGKYGVDVGAVDELSRRAFDRALGDADYFVVDEVAPMEVTSDAFVDGVGRALDAESPVVAAVHYRSASGVVGEVTAREDVELFDLTAVDRDELPGTLAERVRGWLDGD